MECIYILTSPLSDHSPTATMSSSGSDSDSSSSSSSSSSSGSSSSDSSGSHSDADRKAKVRLRLQRMRQEAKERRIAQEQRKGRYLSTEAGAKSRRRVVEDDDDDDDEDGVLSREDDLDPVTISALVEVLDITELPTFLGGPGAPQKGKLSPDALMTKYDWLETKGVISLESTKSSKRWAAFQSECDRVWTEFVLREKERIELEAHGAKRIGDDDEDDEEDDEEEVHTSDAEFLTDDEDQGDRVVVVEDDEPVVYDAKVERIGLRLQLVTHNTSWRPTTPAGPPNPTITDIARFEAALKEKRRKKKKKKRPVL